MVQVDEAFGSNHQDAAEQGVAEAQYRLGLRCSIGQGVQQDLVTAHKWFNLAAMRGIAEARRVRCEIAHDMSEHEISEAQKLAREWLRRH